MWSREQTVVQSEWWVSTQDIYMFVWLKYHNVALVHLALLSLAESLHFNLNKIWQVNLIGLMTSVFSQTASLECTAKVIHNLNLLSVKKRERKDLTGKDHERNLLLHKNLAETFWIIQQPFQTPESLFRSPRPKLHLYKGLYLGMISPIQTLHTIDKKQLECWVWWDHYSPSIWWGIEFPYT